MIAGQQGRMARTGLGRGMALITVAEDRAGREAGEPAGKLRTIFVEQIGRELIDGDDDEKLGRRGRLACGLAGEQSRRGSKNELTHGASCTPAKAGVQP